MTIVDMKIDLNKVNIYGDLIYLWIYDEDLFYIFSLFSVNVWFSIYGKTLNTL